MYRHIRDKPLIGRRRGRDRVTVRLAGPVPWNGSRSLTRPSSRGCHRCLLPSASTHSAEPFSASPDLASAAVAGTEPRARRKGVTRTSGGKPRKQRPLGANVRPYDLRHSFASLLLHEGRSVIYVARNSATARRSRSAPAGT
jgi:hypothetical protein